MSLFSVFLLLWHLGTSWHWRDWPSQGLPIPGDSKLACESTFHMQTNQLKSPYLDHLLYHTQGHYSPAPIPWPSTRQLLGTAVTPQRPLKLFKLGNLKSAYLISAILPTESTIKAPAHVSLFPPQHFLATPILPMCLPPIAWSVPLLLGSMSIINYLFNGNYLLLYWPHHTWMIIIYILKVSSILALGLLLFF